jgi:hypothetical protein
MHRPLLVLAAALCLTLGAAAPAGALEVSDQLQLHGYGNWAYGKTDGNAYMNGHDEGDYDRLEFSLSVTAQPAERTTVHAQLFVEKEEEGAEASVDFAFAEYAFSPLLAFRVGRVKQPFGIYTEIYDVGTLYPFVSLAQGIYGPAGFVTEGYQGAGFTGRWNAESDWSIQYDLYGGEMESALMMPAAAPEAGEEAAAETEEGEIDIQDMVGGRINVSTPGEIMTCGVSAYTGTSDNETSAAGDEELRHTAFGAHAELVVAATTIRAEYARQDAEEYTVNAAYGEASWKVSPHWALAVRYDWSDTELEDGAGVDATLLEHRDFGVAVNYFFNPNFVLKLAWHLVEGNRFTTVDDEDTAMDEKTSLVTFGTSFSF